MPYTGGKVRPVRCGSVLGGKLGWQAMPVQVNHLVSWILENWAPGIFSGLFFEVLKMKALQTIATPHCNRVGDLSGKRSLLLPGVGMGQKWSRG